MTRANLAGTIACSTAERAVRLQPLGSLAFVSLRCLLTSFDEAQPTLECGGLPHSKGRCRGANFTGPDAPPSDSWTLPADSSSGATGCASRLG